MKKVSTALFVMALFTFIMNTAVRGQLLVEDFGYTADTKLSVSGSPNWVFISGTDSLRVVSGSLSYTGYASSGLNNMVRLKAQTTSAEDDYRQFTTQASGIVYGSFLLNVIDTLLISPNGTAKSDYFIGLIQSNSTSAFVGRIMARKGTATNTFQIGLLTNTTNTQAKWSSDLNPGTTYLIAWSYQIVSGSANDITRLWINPAIGTKEPVPTLQDTAVVGATDATDIARVFLRQGTGATTGSSQPNVYIDGIRVTRTWPLKYFTPSASHLSFGNVVFGSSKEDSVTVTNIGSATINISSVASDNPDFSVVEGSGTIAAGSSAVFHVTFAPSSGGLKNGHVVFTHDGSSSPDTVTVSGTGLVAEFRAKPSSHNFGNVVVGLSDTVVVTISNPGGTTLNISDVVSDNPDFSVSPTSGIIAPLDSTTFEISFTPSGPGGSSANIIFTHDADSSPDTVAVSGTGVQAGFFVAPSSVAFGSVFVGLSKADSVKVTNSGNDSLDVSSVDSDNPEFSVNTSIKLGPGDSAWFHITFTPSGPGAKSGNIVFTHDAPSSPDTVSVSGTGVMPAAPSITGVNRSTRVPNTGNSVTVSATVTDTVGVASVWLLYSVDGAAQDSVAMTSSGGSAYSGNIPGSANADGNRIEYQIRANSLSGQSTLTAKSATNSYFAGVSPLSLSGVRAMDASRKILYTNYYARVTGTVNAPNDQTNNYSYYIQDAVGGINVFQFGLLGPVLKVGDSITVIGKFAQFSGKTEITPDNATQDIAIVDSGKSLVITDLTLAGFLADPEPHESRLIRMSPLYKRSNSPSWPGLGSSVNMIMYQTDTAQTIVMRIDSDYEIDGSPEPQYPIRVTGLGGQFSSSSLVYNNGYQLQPRLRSDIEVVTDVEEEVGVPKEFALKQNYPNPFNPSTTIRYALSEEAFVTLRVYNVLGQEVRQLRNEEQNASYYNVVWNGLSASGAPVASGIYFYRLEAQPLSGKAFTNVKKMLLLK